MRFALCAEREPEAGSTRKEIGRYAPCAMRYARRRSTQAVAVRRNADIVNEMAGWRRRALTVCFLAVSGVAFLLSSCSAVRVQEGKTLVQQGAVRPTWNAGERWIYAWTAGTEKGIKTTEARGVREVKGVPYQVMRMEPLDVYFTPDLHWAWAATVSESRVITRAVPPLPWFTWPLKVGRRWDYQGTIEDQQRKESLRDSYKVVGVEKVEVPAGTFQAVKVVRELNGSVVDEYWYAPEVRWYVKWVGRRGKDEFQEVLQEHIGVPYSKGGAAP